MKVIDRVMANYLGTKDWCGHCKRFGGGVDFYECNNPKKVCSVGLYCDISLDNATEPCLRSDESKCPLVKGDK